MIAAHLSAFGASFIYIGIKAAQQINVVHDKRAWVIPCSVGMATCEFYLVGFMVTLGPGVWSILAIGVGAGLGCLLAMWWHKRRK